jgi:Flp pilus assembly protein CpaB
MLLGVLLALAAGTIVIFIVSQATTSSTQVVTVVVAKQDLPAGTILSVTGSDTTHTLITDAFTTKQVAADFVPENAFAYTTGDALNLELNNKVVVGTFYGGEILRHPDPRLVVLGTGAAGSLTNINPAQLTPGSVLTVITLDASVGGRPLAVAGDSIDILVTECGLDPTNPAQNCETQTTLQNIPVYSVQGSSLIVVLKHQDALVLKYLEETGKGEIVVRKPGDSTSAGTTPVNLGTIVKEFGY